MALLKPNNFLLLAVVVNLARAHVAFLGGPNHLHQVQGIYIKPSSDGTTGDLYVAATEDSGVNVKSPWLEQPINFLPQVAYSQSLPDEVVVTNQKRAVFTSPTVKYSYGVPVSSEGSVANAVQPAVPYSYTIPATPVAATEGSESGDAVATPALPYYQYPYHLYYTQMMSAFANALNNAAAKESTNETGEEGTGTTTSTTAKPVTPQAPVWPYSYPVQYVMVDPSAWAKAQAAAPAQATSTTEASITAASEESS